MKRILLPIILILLVSGCIGQTKQDSSKGFSEVALAPAKVIASFNGELYFGGDGIQKLASSGTVQMVDKESVGEVGAFGQFNGDLYAGSGDGLYVLSDGKWIKLAGNETGEIEGFVEYKNEFYVAGNNGVFKLKDKKLEESLKLVNRVGIFSLGVYKDVLFAGGDGIYLLKDGEWVQTADTENKGIIEIVESLVEYNGEFYAGSTDGLFKYQNGEWVQVAPAENIGAVGSLVSHKGSLFSGGSTKHGGGKGIYKLDSSALTLISTQDMIGSVASLVVHNGEIYAATMKGVYKYAE